MGLRQFYIVLMIIICERIILYYNVCSSVHGHIIKTWLWESSSSRVSLSDKHKESILMENISYDGYWDNPLKGQWKLIFWLKDASSS